MRAENLHRTDIDEGFRVGLIENSKRDVIFFFNQFCWTYDPRKESKPNHFPFITYPFQDDYILELEAAFQGNRDLLTEKSRDMGVSWMVLTWILWHWLFDSSFNALVGSRKEDLVDNFQLDSLFGKLAYTIKRLPTWILPKGFDYTKHRSHMRIVNPESGSTIQGESANQEFSRQGRYSVCMLDEFAFWQWADAVWEAVADSAPVRFPVSTPKGKNNRFADERFSGRIKVATLHWTLHPKKDQAWYDKEKARRTPRAIAQELDIDYEASGTERVFSLKTNKTLRDRVIIEPFEIPKDWKMRGGLDYGTRNKSAFHVFAKNYDGDDFCIFEWRRNMEDLQAEGFKGSMVQAIALMLFENLLYPRLDVIMADPSLWVKNQNSPDGMTSIIQQVLDELRKLKAEREKFDDQATQFVIKGFSEGAQSDIQCVEEVNTAWSDPINPRLKIFKTCKGLIEEIDELMWEDWSEAQQEKRNIKEKVMDRNNHSWDAMKYYILSKNKGPKKTLVPQRGSLAWLEKRDLEENFEKRLRS